MTRNQEIARMNVKTFYGGFLVFFETLSGNDNFKNKNEEDDNYSSIFSKCHECKLRLFFLYNFTAEHFN